MSSDEAGNVEMGSSPPCRPVVVEASDLFRAVLSDLLQTDNTKISRTELERYKSARQTKQSSTTSADGNSQSQRCSQCSCVIKLCKCGTNINQPSPQEKRVHVHWVDEVWDKPLCQAQPYECDSKRSPSPEPRRRNSLKPILKHRANCIIIISDR